MSLNPIVFTEKIVRSFLRYQLTAYPFADERLLAQMRQLLSLDATRNSPLLKGPFISVSRHFRSGAAVDALIAEGVFHPHMRQRIPAEISHVYGHQDEAIRSIHAGRTTLVSTGTGISFGMYVGKTAEKEAEVAGIPPAQGCIARRLQGQTQGSPRRKTQRHGLPTRRGLLARGDAPPGRPAPHTAHQCQTA
jgi:hypothetical protein